MSDEFLKDDKDKARPALIPEGFVMLMGEVFAYGAKKYEVDNWQKCEDSRRYVDAALRHVYQFAEGETNDDPGKGGSGLHHLGHAAASIAMLWGITQATEPRRREDFDLETRYCPRCRGCCHSSAKDDGIVHCGDCKKGWAWGKWMISGEWGCCPFCTGENPPGTRSHEDGSVSCGECSRSSDCRRWDDAARVRERCRTIGYDSLVRWVCPLCDGKSNTHTSYDDDSNVIFCGWCKRHLMFRPDDVGERA